MLDALKNALFAGIGLAAITQEKLKSVVEELVKRGELSAEQGKKVFDELLEKSQAEGKALSDRIAAEVMRLLEKAPMASRRELRNLESRVKALEAKLGPPEDASGLASGSGGIEPGPARSDICGLDEEVGV